MIFGQNRRPRVKLLSSFIHLSFLAKIASRGSGFGVVRSLGWVLDLFVRVVLKIMSSAHAFRCVRLRFVDAGVSRKKYHLSADV